MFACPRTSTFFLMFFVAWRSPARCKTKQVRDKTVSVVEHSRIIFHQTFFHYTWNKFYFTLLWRIAPAKLAPAETVRAFYVHVQAMLWRNAPANLAPAETVRAFYATVLVIHAPAETVRANGAMLRRRPSEQARQAFLSILICFFKFRHRRGEKDW